MKVIKEIFAYNDSVGQSRWSVIRVLPILILLNLIGRRGERIETEETINIMTETACRLEVEVTGEEEASARKRSMIARYRAEIPLKD